MSESVVKRRLSAPEAGKSGSDLQCAFDDYGMRCTRPGTISPATTGHGPWYCLEHYGPGGPGYYTAKSREKPKV